MWYLWNNELHRKFIHQTGFCGVEHSHYKALSKRLNWLQCRPHRLTQSHDSTTYSLDWTKWDEITRRGV